MTVTTGRTAPALPPPDAPGPVEVPRLADGAGLPGGDLGRALNAGQVRHLITAKLLPPGIAATEGTPAVPPEARISFRVASVFPPGRGLVVVMQSGGLGCGGADRGDRHVETFGEPVERGRARRPGQVPCHGEGVDRGPRQLAAAGDLTVGPAPLAHPLLDQPLQRVDARLRRRSGRALPLSRKIPLAPNRMRRHSQALAVLVR